MRVTDSENGEHSTALHDPRPRLRRRFFGSLLLIGLLVGLMIGRLAAPGPVQLLRVEPQASGLQLWFDREPQLHSEQIDGAIGMLIQAQGNAQRGELQLDGTPLSWRLQTSEQGLLLHFVAIRPLTVEWSGQAAEDGWRLNIALKPRYLNQKG